MAARPRIVKPKPPLVRVATSAPEREADDFIHDRGADESALKGLSSDADMTETQRLKAVRLSRLNYKRSGIYGQLVDTLVNFVVGDGLALKPKEEEVESWLDEVFKAPANKFHGSLRSRYTNAIVDGELLISITVPTRRDVNPGEPLALTAKPLIGKMDVDSIVQTIASAVNEDVLLFVVVDPGGGKPKVSYPIARPGVMPRDNGDGTATAVLLWQVNKLKRRGLPFFSRTLDKAHMLDGVVDELAKKAKYTSRFYLHATYEDQNDKKKNAAIEKRLLAWMRSWQPGEALASTKGVAVECFAPDLKLQDQKALYDLVVDYVLGSHGIPRHWFSSGGDTNRATSVEQGTPIFRAVDAAQSQFVDDVQALVSYVVWLGKIAGRLDQKLSDEVSVVPTDVATRDSIRDTKEVNDLMAALDMAVLNGTLSRIEAQKIGRRVFSSKGWGDDLDEVPPPLPDATAPGLDAKTLPGHRGAETDPALNPTVPGSGEGGPAPQGGTPGLVPGSDTIVQDTALNGAQVASLLEIVQAVSDGTLPAAAARPMLLAAFPSCPEALIDQMIAAADEFEPPEPKEPPVTPPPAGGEQPQKPDPAKPPTTK